MAELNKELLAEYKKLAKRADQRLVRLEQAADQRPGYSKAKDWAYKSALSDVRKWGGSEAKRFNIKPPATNRQLEAKIQDIKHFLGLQTSTVKGITAMYKNAANSFNNAYGTNFTSTSFKKFWDSGIGDSLKKSFGSETAFKAIGKISEKPMEIAKKISDASDKIQFVDDKILNSVIKKMLGKYGKELVDLF